MIPRSTIPLLLTSMACQPAQGPAFRPSGPSLRDTARPLVDDTEADTDSDSDADTDADADAGADTDADADLEGYTGPAYACMRSVWPDAEPRQLGLGSLERTEASSQAYSGPPGLLSATTSVEQPAHECRLWAVTAPDVPGAVLRAHLVDLPDSIKNLGESNDNGWGLGWWTPDDDEAVIHRGEAPAYEDAFFDDAVAQAAADSPTVAVAHVRACSSGLCHLPDPHPFHLELMGRHWLLGHNGTISKDLLLSLVDPDFLDSHPPDNGENADEWIDSELYLRLILQYVEARDGDVEGAIQAAIWDLHDGDGQVSGANFFLSDGETLWAYRDGMTLYWFHDRVVAPCSAVASDYPTDDKGRWNKLSDGQLVVMHPDREPDLLQVWWDQDEEDEDPSF